ncbi:odorant-binding protein-like isoform X2 [Panthera pardus]|uniref:Odorant-binding protein-like isoform X2 n=1 Tax=Panthera pardus TaxID=9691 RepID=A0A9W2UNT5_PANPR|nr:odorant-binding protein-like isoform X2 [Panthera pardus]
MAAYLYRTAAYLYRTATYLYRMAAHLYKTTLHRTNGLCTEKSAVGTIGRDKFINIGYTNQNILNIFSANSHSIVINMNTRRNTAQAFVLLGRRLHPDDNDFAKFRELMRENNIPEENLIDMSKTEKCPKNERGTNPS